MPEQFPARPETHLELEARVQRLRDDAEVLLAVMREQFGDNDTRTTRAGEICDSLQRLRWDLERRPWRSDAAAG